MYDATRDIMRRNERRNHAVVDTRVAGDHTGSRISRVDYRVELMYLSLHLRLLLS